MNSKAKRRNDKNRRKRSKNGVVFRDAMPAPITLKNASFCWGSKNTVPVLRWRILIHISMISLLNVFRNINMEIKEGSLIAVVGKVILM